MTISTMDVWQKFYQSLAELVAGPGAFNSNTQALSFAGNTLLVDLADADPTISNMNIFNCGNVLPAWSPNYTPQGGLLSAYTTFLDNINLGGSINPNLQSQINNAAAAMSTSQNNFITVQGQAITAWKQAQQINPGLPFNTFVQNQFPVYIQAKNDLLGKTSSWQSLMVQAYGAGYEVVANARNACSSTSGAAAIDMQNTFNMAVKSGSTAPAGSGPAVLPGQTPPAPASALVSSFAPAYGLNGFTAIYQEWQQNSVANKQTGGPITVSGSSGAQSWDNYGWSASLAASFSEFFTFTAGGSAAKQTQNLNTQSSQFSLDVMFTGLDTVPINPGQWYDGGIVETFKNKLLASAPQFFGQGGSMGLLPTALILGFEPTITLSLENSDYNSFKSTYQAQATASLNIGPFSIGNASYSTYGDKGSITFNDEKNTIVIGPVQSTLPLLLGVISTKL
jgi:hypothetical protein